MLYDVVYERREMKRAVTTELSLCKRHYGRTKLVTTAKETLNLPDKELCKNALLTWLLESTTDISKLRSGSVSSRAY